MVDRPITPEDRDAAVGAALGRRPFDWLITGASVGDVATGEVRAADIGLSGPLIASVHPPGTRTDAKDLCEAGGALIAPGLIDSHMHIESSMVTPETYAATVLPRGVTTVVWDPHELANVAGTEGMAYAHAAADATALRALVQVPSCVPSAPGFERAGADFDAETIAPLLAEAPAGLAEVMDMAAVTARSPRMRAILTAAEAAGRPISGHARGLSGAELQAYAAAGIGSDHEITSAEDLLEKLRAGLWVELRGSHPHLLPECIEALCALPEIPPTLTLATDDVFPDELHEVGGLDAQLRRVVELGLPPMAALRAATLAPARRLGRADLGLVAPGKRADLVIFDGLETLCAQTVFVDGKPPRPQPPAPPPEALARSMHVAPLTSEDFVLHAQGPDLRLATIDKPRFTAWGEVRAEVEGGRVSLPAGGTWIAVLHRHGAQDTARIGVLTGWGAWRGAFATTISHDSHNLTVFGSNPRDMALAANALIGSGGGMAVASGGAVRAHLALPIGGLISPAPLAEVAAEFQAVRQAMDAVVDWAPPYLVFKALVGATLACNKGPHQTDLGIADPLAGRLLRSPVLPP